MAEQGVRVVRTNSVSRFSDRQAQARRRLFVGREHEQKQFRDCLASRAMPRIFFVHGAGGVGKSSLLHAYAQIADELGTAFCLLDARDLEGPPVHVAAAVHSALAACDDRSGRVLAIDNLQRISVLDAWLRNKLVPGLPENVVLVLAGRERPRPKWAAEPGLSELVLVQELTALDGDVASEYLSRRNVDTRLRDEILEFTRGYPLALALCSDLAGRVPPEAFRAASPDVVSTLVQWLLEDITDPGHRRAIATAATVRRVTLPMLAAVMPSNAEDEFSWLAQQQFMERRTDGLVIHDLVRDVVIRELRSRDVDEHHRVIKRATGYLLGDLDEASLAQARAAINETIYSLRYEPHIKRHFRFDDRSYYSDTAAAHELPALTDEVRRLEGEQSARWFRYWLQTRPDSLIVVRDSDGMAVGMALSLALDRHDLARGSEDPVVTAFFDFLKCNAPLRETERAILLRFMMAHDTHQERTGVWSHLAVLSNAAMFEPHAAFVAFVAELSHDWGGLAENADANFLAGTEYGTGGRQFALIGHDARSEPPVAWARNCTTRILQQGATTQLRPIAARILQKDGFNAAVLGVLKHYFDDASLADSPLLQSAMLRRHAGRSQCVVDDLRNLMWTAMLRLSDGNGDGMAAKILRLAYLESELKLSAAAENVHMSERTFRRRLRDAEHQMQAALWQLETGSS